MDAARTAAQDAWTANILRIGMNTPTGNGGGRLGRRLGEAGALGIVTSKWENNGWGTRRVFGDLRQVVPAIDLSCEDYGLVFRLAKRNQGPTLRLRAESEMRGERPVFNTIAEIKGVQRPDEYVMLSAHFDSWDSASGGTDNGTGTLMMMEAMRVLRKVYPAPRRTILIGHWSGEEQGINGSRAWAEDHPEVVRGLQALFNQDNGTGRIQTISMGGFLKADDSFVRWLSRVPAALTGGIRLSVPGTPPSGGSDDAAFVCHGAPAFFLGGSDWEYGSYTWHTNRDTFDKVVFDDLVNNATLVAMLAYLASEDPERVSREQRTFSAADAATGRGGATSWPTCTAPLRSAANFNR
jgi:hypothetical protein